MAERSPLPHPPRPPPVAASANRPQQATPSYSEMIARQSVIIAQHDRSTSVSTQINNITIRANAAHNSSSGSGGGGNNNNNEARSPTPTRMTFKRVDYASSLIYGNSSNSSSNSKSKNPMVDSTDNIRSSDVAAFAAGSDPIATSTSQQPQRQQRKAQEAPAAPSAMAGVTDEDFPPLACSAVGKGTAGAAGTSAASVKPRSAAPSVPASPATALVIPQPAPIAPPQTQQQPSWVKGSREKHKSPFLVAPTALNVEEPKVLKKPSHHWVETSSSAIAAPSRGCQQYLRRGQQFPGLVNLQQSRCAHGGNGLLQALDRAERGSDADIAARAVTSSTGPGAAAVSGSGRTRQNLLRAAVEAAARQGAAKHGLKSPEKEKTPGSLGMACGSHEDPAPQQAAAGSPNDEKLEITAEGCKDRKKHQDNDSGLQTKQDALPFHHSHQTCRNWLSTSMSPEHEKLVMHLWPGGLVPAADLARRPPKNYSPARAGFRDRASSSRQVATGPRTSSMVLRSRGGSVNGSKCPPGFLRRPQQQTSSPSSHGTAASTPAHSRQVSQRGSWTNSNSWVADEEKERARWTRIQDRMYHAGMSNSPFVPGNFAEYITQRVERADLELQETRERLGVKQTEWDALLEYVAHGGDVNAKDMLAGHQDAGQDDAANGPSSATTVAPIWMPGDGDIWSETHRGCGLWPTVAQLKAYGDQPARRGLARGLPPTESLRRS
ncbi:hypothetical protein Micbo1qcDRAFT_211681 [Microdochium bolleyi]|uniref:Uncharacterized protein n=1 Tax=Microdochium bolleyi TaxID=196109 RepID=A0A136JJT1_9PEZI|nr:hypothetical protein Micbo1qcDRAFT_211681 [Microdochium bolleyi]